MIRWIAVAGLGRSRRAGDPAHIHPFRRRFAAAPLILIALVGVYARRNGATASPATTRCSVISGSSSRRSARRSGSTSSSRTSRASPESTGRPAVPRYRPRARAVTTRSRSAPSGTSTPSATSSCCTPRGPSPPRQLLPSVRLGGPECHAALRHLAAERLVDELRLAVGQRVRRSTRGRQGWVHRTRPVRAV